MLSNLVALATLSGDTRYMDRRSAVLAAFAGELGRNLSHTRGSWRGHST